MPCVILVFCPCSEKAVREGKRVEFRNFWVDVSIPALTSFGVSGLCRAAAGRGALGDGAGGRGVGSAGVFATPPEPLSSMMIRRPSFYVWSGRFAWRSMYDAHTKQNNSTVEAGFGSEERTETQNLSYGDGYLYLPKSMTREQGPEEKKLSL